MSASGDFEVSESSCGGGEALRAVVGLVVVMMMKLLLVQSSRSMKLVCFRSGSKHLAAGSRQRLKKTKGAFPCIEYTIVVGIAGLR